MRDYLCCGGNHLDGGMGLYKRAVCAVCGKTYMRTSQHVYKDCCSWTCLRKTEKPKKRVEMEDWEEQESKRRADALRRAEERVEKCKRRLDYHSKAVLTAKTADKRRAEKKMIQNWRQALKDAREQLESLQRLEQM